MKVGLICALMCTFASFAVGKEFRVGVGEEFAKVITPDQGQLQGSIAHGYRCMLEGSGYHYKFVVLPLARLVYELRAGGVDVGLPLVHEASRDRFAMFGDTVIESSYLRVSLPETKLKHDDPAARYVYIRGFAGKAILEDLKGQTLAVSQWDQAIEMMRRNRADFVLITEKTFRVMTREDPDVFRVEKVSDLSVAFYVSNRQPRLLQALNEANARCRGGTHRPELDQAITAREEQSL